MDRSLDSLSGEFYFKACEVLARCLSRGVPVLISQTSRTPAEHAANLKNESSKVKLSKHLPRSLRGFTTGPYLDKCDAIDVVPYDQFNLHGPDKLKYDAKDPAFGVIGQEAERLGLRWGGRWLDPPDFGHFELAFAADTTRLVMERARPWPTFRNV